MAELDYITIKGFKSIASLERLPLLPVNILIGPNGSGKSNFVGVFAFLQAIREGRLQDYVANAGGANRILHFGAAVTEEMEIEVSFAGETNQYAITLKPTALDELTPHDVAYYWDKKRYSRPYEETLIRRGMEAGITTDPARVSNYVRGHLGSWRLYHFHDTSVTSAMKRTADLDDNRFLRPDGSNLPAFLLYLREKEESVYALIRGAVQQAAPFFRDFQLEPLRRAESKVRLEWIHEGSDAYFDASALSDGTLRFIALATLLLQPRELRPTVILVDEPELGLHPYAVTLLASLMKQAATHSQIIVSTQSPLLLDHFEPEDVLVANRVDGATQLTRLASQDLEEWLEEYSLGQLWEKNELGGRPRSD